MATLVRLSKRNHRIKVQHVSPKIRVTHLKRRIALKHVGRPGAPGAPGQEGPQGVGLPSGGLQGDILVKGDDNPNSYQTVWASSLNYTDKHYVASFTTANQVRVDHNLHKKPAVTIIDSAGDEVEATIDFVNNDQLWLRFTHPFSGIVTCN